MNPNSPSPLAAARQIDLICRRFETSWRGGHRLEIAQCLDDVAPSDRGNCLKELIATELDLQVSSGRQPDLDHYCTRYSVDRAWIDNLYTEIVDAQSLTVNEPIESLSGRRLGDYVIGREIGRGGMGIVYEAIQQSLNRPTAVKVLRQKWFPDPSHVARFERESRTVARLHHSNIVEVYDTGCEDGTHYFSMRHIEGIGLDRALKIGRAIKQTPTALFRDVSRSVDPTLETSLLAESPDSTRRNFAEFVALATPHDASRWTLVAQAGQQILSALQHAHELGVIHRDVKPSNLLMDARGTVWLTDFGLARMESEAGHLTQSIELIGTLRYMAPEAFEGRFDARSDIFSVGLTLYELLTFQSAYDATARRNSLKPGAVVTAIPLRRIDASIPQELESVVLKAISLDPAERYQTAAEFGDDLRRYQAGEPTTATASGDRRRWSVRQIPALIVILFAMFGIAFIAAPRRPHRITPVVRDASAAADPEDNIAEADEAANRLTEDRQRRALEHRIETAVDRSQHEGDGGHLFEMSAWLVEAVQQVQHLKSLDQTSSTAGSALHQETPDQPGESSDTSESSLRWKLGAVDRRLPRAVARYWLPQRLPQWYQGDAPLARETSDWRAARLLFTPADLRVVTEAGDQFVMSLRTGNVRHVSAQPTTTDGVIRVHDATERISVTQDAAGNLTASWADNRDPIPLQTASEFDLDQTLSRVWLVDGEQKLAAQFSRIMKTEAGTSYPVNSLFLWTLATGKSTGRAPLVQSVRGNFECSPAGAIGTFHERGTVVELIDPSETATVSMLSRGNLLRAFDLATGRSLHAIRPADSRQEELRWERSVSGRWFAAGTDKGAMVQNVTSRRPQIWDRPVAAGARISALAFARDDSEIWAGTTRGVIYRRNLLDPNQLLIPWQVGETTITAICSAPSHRWTAVGNSHGEVALVEQATGRVGELKLPHRDSISSIDWSDESDMLGVLTQNGLLTVWDLKTIRPHDVIFGASDASISTIALNSSGQSFLMGATDGRVEIRDTGTGELTSTFSHASGDVMKVAWNDQNTHVAATTVSSSKQSAVGFQNLMCHVWQVGKPEQPLFSRDSVAAKRPSLLMPFFTPDGSRLFIQTGYRGQLIPISAQPDEGDSYVVEPYSWICAGCISRDGRYLALAGECSPEKPNRMSVYEVGSQRRLLTLDLPAALECRHLEFSPDGQLLLACGEFGTRAWQIPSGTPLSPLPSHWQVASSRSSFSQSGRLLVVCEAQDSCRLSARDNLQTDWKSGLTSEPHRLQTDQPVRWAAVTPDDRCVIAVTDASIYLFDAVRGKLLLPKWMHATQPNSMAFSADGTTLLLATQNGAVRRWKLPLTSQAPLATLLQQTRQATLMKVSANGDVLVPLSTDDLSSQNSDLEKSILASLMSADERADWHGAQADECRLAGHVEGEVYHLKRILSRHNSPDRGQRLTTLESKQATRATAD